GGAEAGGDGGVAKPRATVALRRCRATRSRPPRRDGPTLRRVRLRRARDRPSVREHEDFGVEGLAGAGTPGPGHSVGDHALQAKGPATPSGIRCPRGPTTGASLLALAEVAQDRLERVDDLFARRAALVEAELEVERLRRRPEGEHVVLGAPWLRLGGGLPQLPPCGPALARNLLHERGHFLGRILPNHLEEQRLG